MTTHSTAKHDPTRGLERWLSAGLDFVSQTKALRAERAKPIRERRMVSEHRAALAAHRLAVRRYRKQLSSARSATVLGGIGAVGIGVAAFDPPGNASPALTVVAILSAFWARRSHMRLRHLQQSPPVAALPPLPPARLPHGARGSVQADRVANALLSLYDLLPSVSRLNPPVGRELWQSVAGVEPLLRDQVGRLDALIRIERELAGTHASLAAASAGETIGGRLLAGADALEELIAAATGFLGAPDLADPVEFALAPAILDLEAFACGLHAADATRMP